MRKKKPTTGNKTINEKTQVVRKIDHYTCGQNPKPPTTVLTTK